MSTEPDVLERLGEPVTEPAVPSGRDTRLEKLIRGFESKPTQPSTPKPKLRFQRQREPFAFD